jgi:hypothetical protein
MSVTTTATDPVTTPVYTDVPFEVGTGLGNGRVAETIHGMRMAMALNDPGLPPVACPVGIVSDWGRWTRGYRSVASVAATRAVAASCEDGGHTRDQCARGEAHRRRVRTRQAGVSCPPRR